MVAAGLNNVFLLTSVAASVVVVLSAIAAAFGKTFLRPVRDDLHEATSTIVKLADDLGETREHVAKIQGQMEVLLNPRKVHY